MHDEDKTKEELISELRELRQQLEAQLAFSHSDKVNSALKRNQLSLALRQSRKDLIKSQSKTAASNKALTEFREALHTSEQNLADAHERYNILSDLVPFGVWTADAQGKITFLSDAFLEMSGIKTEDTANLEWVDQLSRPVVLSAVSDWSSEADKRDIWESEFWITSQTGRQYCILIRGVPLLNKQGKTLSWLGINLDISERKRAEEKLRCNSDELERLVQQRTSELARSNQAKSDFVANISHEIRTPLSGLIGMIELALRSSSQSKIKEYLDLAKEASNHLFTIINDILDFSKIESGKVQLFPIAFSLPRLLQGTFFPLQVMAAEKGINFTINAAEDVPDVLVGDPHRLRQILENIAGNALKFTHEGQITLSVGLDPESNEQSGIQLLFKVVDTGIGIPQDQQDSIFDSFSQVSSSDQYRYQGTGLGLFISKRLLEMMGGNIWFTSQEGKGTTFFFTAVFEYASEHELQAPQDDTPESPVGSLNILVAEDSPINQMFTSELLKERGHEVTVVEDGRQALQALAEKSFDLVLMDIRMPNMGGEETLRIIRNEAPPEIDSAIPVIALTAHALEEDRERFLEDGFDGHLAKPIDIEALHKAILGIEKLKN